jgi:DNA ligase-1
MSEKMDGVRAYWNGNTLISRNAKDISCPKWFIEQLPKSIKLDGELWMGRGSFERCNATLNSSEDESSWKKMKYILFDAVIPNLLYEDRISLLRNIELPEHVSVVDTKRCISNEDLLKKLNQILLDGGEGIVVTKAGSMYVAERTRNRLKVKVNSFQISFF